MTEDSEYENTHKKVKKVVDEKTTKKACGCVSVNEIASELMMDPRTVKKHLGVMEIDEYGKYLDPNEKIFCSREGIEGLAKSFKKKKKKSAEGNFDEDDDLW